MPPQRANGAPVSARTASMRLIPRPPAATVGRRLLSRADYAGAVRSMEVVEPAGEGEFGGLDELRVGDPHTVKLAIEIALPEFQELAEVGETRGQIEVLPDKALQNMLVIGHPVEDFGGGDSVIVKLRNKRTIHRVHSLTRHSRRNSHAPLTKNR